MWASMPAGGTLHALSDTSSMHWFVACRLDSNASLSEMWASMLHGDPSGMERISSEQAALPETQAQPLSLPPLAAAGGVANLLPGSLLPLPMLRTISSGITSAFEPWKGGGSSTNGAAARPGELLACVQLCRSSCHASVQGASFPSA